jgi:hypothetical protein
MGGRRYMGKGDGEIQGRYMGKEVGRYMGGTWEVHGRYMGGTWEVHGRYRKREMSLLCCTDG